MELRVYTIHHQPGRELEAVCDRIEILGFIMPLIWAAWNRLWVILFGIVSILIVAAAVTPAAVVPTMYGIAAICGLEGGALRRLEFRIRGWREVAVVQASTEEGAEELYLNGRIA